MALSHPTPPPAPLAGVGEVCLFYAPTGAPIKPTSLYFGHVGWGFRLGQQNEWIFGATEGTGAPNILPPDYNGAWVDKGDWDTMLNIFENKLLDAGNTYYHDSGYYTQFRCRVTIASNVSSAESLAYSMKNKGYDLTTNNCLTDAYQILSTYAGENIFPTPFFPGLSASGQIGIVSAIPKQWFSELAAYGFSGLTPLPQRECSTPRCPPYALVATYPNMTFPSVAIVKIVPASPTLQTTYTITAIPGKPNVAKRQVFARAVTATTAAISQTVPATGQGQTQGTQASGLVDIINQTDTPLTLDAGTIIPNNAGFGNAPNIQIMLDTGVTVPGCSSTSCGSANVNAIVVQPGAIGNVGTTGAFYFCSDGTCNSANEWFVEIASAFTGGTDPQPYTYVQQSDIDNAANALIAANKPDAQRVLQRQIPSGERLIGTPQCNPNTSANQSSGDQVSQVTVKVTFTCSGEVYDYNGALTMAKNLLAQLGNGRYPSYKLVGIGASMQKVELSPLNNGVVLLTIQARGTWQAQFDAHTQLELATALVGLSKAEAEAFLLHQSDIQIASIQLKGGSVEVFPSDPSQVKIIIQD